MENANSGPGSEGAGTREFRARIRGCRHCIFQLRRSCSDPVVQTDVSVAHLLGPAASYRDLYFLLAAGWDEACGNQKEPASAPFGFGVLFRHDEPNEQDPEVVD